MASVRAVSGALGRAAAAASRCAYHSLASAAARPVAGSLPAWLASSGSAGVDRVAPSLGDVPPAAIGDCDVNGSGWDRQRLIRDSVIGDFDGAAVPRGLPLEEGAAIVGDGGAPAGGSAGVSIEAMNRNAREGTKVRQRTRLGMFRAALRPPSCVRACPRTRPLTPRCLAATPHPTHPARAGQPRQAAVQQPAAEAQRAQAPE